MNQDTFKKNFASPCLACEANHVHGIEKTTVLLLKDRPLAMDVINAFNQIPVYKLKNEKKLPKLFKLIIEHSMLDHSLSGEETTWQVLVKSS